MLIQASEACISYQAVHTALERVMTVTDRLSIVK